MNTPTLKLAFLAASTLLCSLIASSQGHFQCGTDEMHQQLFQQHPQYNAGIIRANERLTADTRNFIEQFQAKSDAAYVIPVVFHVIHNYGVENISDAQILDGLKQLNTQFRKLNADTTSIVSTFKSRAADCEVEFRLAQLDPDGNCTAGITRTVSDLTMIGDHQVKSLIHWPADRYLNVYICNQAAGLAGHSMMPAAADTMPHWDGIVMQHSYVGTIGTSDDFKRTVLTHEVGHFLNLQHIWGGNNVPNYYYLPVANAGNCAFDDEVDDTPNTIGWQSCNLTGATCGELDNVQNYMDYAYCGLMFTEGQKARMHAALNSPVAKRNNLWQAANLSLTGTDQATSQLCKANIDISRKNICAGESVTFSDVSLHGVTQRTWEFEGGVATSLTDSLVAVTYANPGKYSVKITVGNGIATLDTTFYQVINVLSATANSNFLNTDVENWVAATSDWFQDTVNTGNYWKHATVGANSGHSFVLNNSEFPFQRKYELISRPIDMRNVAQIGVSFDHAYGRMENTGIDGLTIMISKDCGQTWTSAKSLSGTNSLKTVASVAQAPFVPSNESEWKNTVINTINNTYKVANFMVKFVFDNKSTNNIYLDNINVGDFSALSLATLEQDLFAVSPNPAHDKLEIQLLQSAQITSVELLDVTGKLIEQKNITAEHSGMSVTLDVRNVVSGMYVLKIATDKGIFVRNHVIAH